MDEVNLIKAVQKASSIISSCNTCEHVENAENYLENFKKKFNQDEYYEKLILKLKEKRTELKCE